MRDSKQKQSWFICSSFSSHTARSNWGQDRTGTHSLLGRLSSASQTAFKRKTSVMSSEVCVFLPCWHDSGVPLAPSHQLFESLFGQEEESWEEDGPGSHEAPHGNTLLRSVHVCVCVALLSRSRGCGRLGEHGLVGVVWGRSLLLPPVRGVVMGEDLQAGSAESRFPPAYSCHLIICKSVWNTSNALFTGGPSSRGTSS